MYIYCNKYTISVWNYVKILLLWKKMEGVSEKKVISSIVQN